MPYWNFEYTKVKVGGGTGQDPATEVTHLRLNQPPVFSSAIVGKTPFSDSDIIRQESIQATLDLLKQPLR